MLISINCIGYVDKKTKLASCGIILESGEFNKRLAFGLGKVSDYIANMQAIRMALRSIGRKFRQHDIKLHGYSKKAFQNIVEANDSDEIVMDAYNLYTEFDNIELILRSGSSDDRDKARELAKSVVLDQRNISWH